MSLGAWVSVCVRRDLIIDLGLLIWGGAMRPEHLPQSKTEKPMSLVNDKSTSRKMPCLKKLTNAE
jgi:hypothetical protein